VKSSLIVGLLLLAGAGCDEKPAAPTPERFAAVRKSVKAAGGTFCEKSYPAGGPLSRKFTPAAVRAFGKAPEKAPGWTWVNVWATWCKPCVEEMGVLNKWHQAISREGLAVSFELLSIDETSAGPALEEWRTKTLPGPIVWLRAEEDFGPFLDGLGIDRNTAIPVHALVDPKGMLRCVRVGAIHEQNYGAVRDLLVGG
jgi:thiol-disulfide isomerase/thioredoxin